MKPEDFRELRIHPGTQIGLIGDYNAPSTWSRDKRVIATLERYVVVERRLLFGQGISWDTAAIVVLEKPLRTISFSSEEFLVNTLLLMHRYACTEEEIGIPQPVVYFPPWEDKVTVVVEGLHPEDNLGTGPLSRDDWESKVSTLSGAADLTIESLSSSEAAAALEKSERIERQKDEFVKILREADIVIQSAWSTGNLFWKWAFRTADGIIQVKTSQSWADVVCFPDAGTVDQIQIARIREHIWEPHYFTKYRNWLIITKSPKLDKAIKRALELQIDQRQSV